MKHHVQDTQDISSYHVPDIDPKPPNTTMIKTLIVLVKNNLRNNGADKASLEIQQSPLWSHQAKERDFDFGRIDLTDSAAISSSRTERVERPIGLRKKLMVKIVNHDKIK